MKFIHTADLHIGDSWKFLPQDYLTRQALMLDSIYQLAYRKKIKTIVVAGDLFHKKEPNRECRDLVLSKLLYYDRFFQTIIMEGNHDSVEATASNIHYLKILYDKKRFKNTTIVELNNQVVPIEDGAFIVMPRFDERTLLNLVKETKNRYKWLVAVLHTTTIGAKSDTNWVAQKGWDISPVAGINYYAFGHIHKFQRLTLPNAFQSGSPIQHKWSDKLPKGILIVDTDYPKNPSFVSLSKIIKPLYTIKDDEKVPEFGYVRLMTNKSLNNMDLPVNVVATERDLSDIQVAEYKGELNPTKGLIEYLAKEGLTKEEQLRGLEIVEDIVQNIQWEE